MIKSMSLKSGYLGGPIIITNVLVKERRKKKSQSQSQREWKDATPLALKKEEGAINQGM